ncbi:MAG: YggS family pyridoxal phosphate-dependent enzyme [Gammaproteobacteria bacterium]|nr:YggS family pyridoxal phosphate-dependent enzyme [Gammaproteobacteria bacterium]
MIDVAENIRAASQKIRALEQEYGRPEGAVSLLAASKRQSIAKIREAAAAGLLNIGENYLQEALDKKPELADIPQLVWHFIGPIQSNKTRGIAETFDWVHSVDRAKIAKRLNDQRPAGKGPLNVCVQVKLSAEESKSGTKSSEASELCQQIAELPNLTLRGLMAIPAATDDEAAQHRAFSIMAYLCQSLQTSHPDMDTLSMGMSNDYAAAIAEGSTMIRLGTALFGPRQF